jgi:hypothetical protein
MEMTELAVGSGDRRPVPGRRSPSEPDISENPLIKRVAEPRHPANLPSGTHNAPGSDSPNWLDRTSFQLYCANSNRRRGDLDEL